MPRLVLTDAFVLFASNDISQFVTSISLSTSFDVIDTTGLSTPGVARTRQAGLADNQITIEFNQDFGAGLLESLVFPTLGTAVAMQVRPVNTTVGATNPKYTFNALVAEWQALSGAVGELVTASVTWPVSGPITKSITP